MKPDTSCCNISVYFNLLRAQCDFDSILFSGSRKVCDIFVDSGVAVFAKCTIHALSDDVTSGAGVAESPGFRRMSELGLLLLKIL